MVDELEMQYYETQLELYNIQFETLKYEELLVVAQLDTLRREARGKWLFIIPICTTVNWVGLFQPAHSFTC